MSVTWAGSPPSLVTSVGAGVTSALRTGATTFAKEMIPEGIIADSRGVYGYLPKTGSRYDHSLFDFTNEEFVARNRKIRESYIEGTNELENAISAMREAGASSEEIARRVVLQRNSQKIEARALMTPAEVELLESGNIKRFRDANAGIGPTPDQMFDKLGDWDLVIESSLRKDPEINMLLGIDPSRY